MTGTRSKHTDALKLGNRIKLALVLLCVGLIGLGIVGTFMYRKAEAFNELSAYASRGALVNVSDIFQIPAIMFFAILTLYAISELYKSYKAMNDPETYRNASSKRVGISAERTVSLEKRQKKKRQSPPAAGQSRRKSSGQSSRQKRDQSKDPSLPQITDQSNDRSAGLSASQIPKPVSKPTKVGRNRRGPVR